MAIKRQSPLQGVEWTSNPFFVATMPLPPSVNESFKTNRSAQFYGSDKLCSFKEDAVLMLKQQQNAQRWDIIEEIKLSIKKIPLKFDLTFYFKTLWKRDCSGAIKAAEDAAFDFIGINDNRVVRLCVEKFVDANKPRCEILISVCLDRM